jgi:hypothetical protein
MAQNKIIAAAVGVSVVASVTCLVWASHDDKPRRPAATLIEAQVSSTPSDAAALEQLAELKRDVRRMEATQLEAAREVRTQPSGKGEGSARAAQAEVEKPALTPQQYHAAQTQLLEDHLRADPKDDAATELLYAALDTSPMPGAADTVVNCGRNLCRIEAAFESAVARDQGLSALGRAVPWDFDAYYRAGDDPDRQMIVYLTREQTSLPVPE